MSWQFSRDYINEKHFKKFKNNEDDLASCLANLDRLGKLLEEHGHPNKIQTNWFKSEKGSVWRIAQRKQQNSREIRLYVYICIVNGIIYLLEIGDKSSQSTDIQACKEKVKSILK